MVIRSVYFFLSFSLIGCMSQILSVEDWSKTWVGDPIEKVERVYERDGKTWYAVKRVTSDRTIYTSLQRDHSFGKCYVDFTVNSLSGLIVDYHVYGDEYACK